MLRVFVGVEADRAFFLRDLDRYDFILETSGLLCRLGLVLRGHGERILVRTRHFIFLRDVLGCHTHVILVIDVPQAVHDHGVDQLGVAHAEAVARIVEHMGGRAHVLLAAGNDDVGVAAAYRLGRKMRGLETAAADLVDGEAGYGIGKTGLDERLSRGILANSGGEDLAEDDFTDGSRVDSGLL